MCVFVCVWLVDVGGGGGLGISEKLKTPGVEAATHLIRQRAGVFLRTWLDVRGCGISGFRANTF